jgi:parallel beta-helix repeat protein
MSPKFKNYFTYIGVLTVLVAVFISIYFVQNPNETQPTFHALAEASTTTSTSVHSEIITSTPYPTFPSQNTYYVSTTGSDTNAGSILLPWKTVDYAVGELKAGDKLYLRGGVYDQTISIRVNGTAQSPITISGYPNETVILDGKGKSPSSAGSYMITIRGSWVIVKDIEIANSGQGGVFSEGTHVTVQNMNIHHAQGAAITLTGDYDLALLNHAWSDGLMNENNKSGISGGWPAILTCARYPKYCTLRGNTVSDSWGEGISTFEATYTTIEDNISYNNQQNFYLSDTKYSLLRRNLSYCTPGNAIDPYMTQNGILVGDEKGVLIDGVRYPSSDNQIVNNLVMGCDRNLAAGTKVSTNNLYAYNTFVNSGGDSSERANVLLYVSGSCTNCRFFNNLILQESANPISLGGGINNGWTFSNNLWSKSPGPNFRGEADILADPLLAKIGSIGPGQLTANYFKITANSPAINKAKNLPEVLEDFFQTIRALSPDIGAHDYGS